MDKINILGINISTLNKDEVLERIGSFLSDGRQHQIVTPNPEFILEARNDEEFFYILNRADLAIPDGVGLKFAGWLLGKDLSRITGADLTDDLLRMADEKGLKVLAINWGKALSRGGEIIEAIRKKFPTLKMYVSNIHETGVTDPFRKHGDEDYFKNKFRSEPPRPGFFEEANGIAPDIALVTFGAPYQEKFIYHNLFRIPSLKIAIGIGGSLDFYTGKTKRAPKLVRTAGLEWLWRLWRQPWRWKRIYRAVFVFSWKFFKWRFVKPFFYRSNVVCMIYKKEGNDYKILLVERQNDPGHWQMPQGGTGGESLEAAGLREMREELGSEKFRPVCASKNIWKYKFGNRVSKYGVTSKLARGYKGQKQGLLIAEFTGKDEEIRINFWDHRDWKWIEAQDLVEGVHETRKGISKKCLDKFYGQVNQEKYEVKDQKIHLSYK